MPDPDLKFLVGGRPDLYKIKAQEREIPAAIKH